MDREIVTSLITKYEAQAAQAYLADLERIHTETMRVQSELDGVSGQSLTVDTTQAEAGLSSVADQAQSATDAITSAGGQVEVETAQAEAGLSSVATEATEATEEIGGLSDKAGSLGGVLDNLASGGVGNLVLGMAGLTVGVKAVGAAYDFVKETINESLALYEVQAQAEAQLEHRLIATGGAAGLSAEQIYAHASALQEVTRVGDEAIIPAQSMLLTFKDIKAEGGIFDRATETVLDLATAMNSGATPSMGQLVGQSVQLGKALNDPLVGLTALTRVGVSFSEEQKETIRLLTETGQVAEAQTIILDELAAQYGGSAAAAAETFAGKQEQLSNTVGDVKEAIGDLLAAKAEPFLEWLMTGQDEAAELTERLRGTADAIRDVGTLRDEYRKLTGNEFSASRAAYGAANASLLSDIFGYGVSDRQELELLIEALDRLKGYELFTTDYVDDHYTELEAAAEAAAKLEEQMKRLTTSYEDGDITLSEYTRKLALFNGLTDAEGLLTEKGAEKLHDMVGAYGSSSYAADEYYARQQTILEGGDEYLSFHERQAQAIELSAQELEALNAEMEEWQTRLGAISDQARGSAETSDVFGRLAESTGETKTAVFNDATEIAEIYEQLQTELTDTERQGLQDRLTLLEGRQGLSYTYYTGDKEAEKAALEEIMASRRQLIIDLIREQADVETSLGVRIALGDITVEEADAIRAQLQFIDIADRLFGRDSVTIRNGIRVNIADVFLEQEDGADIVRKLSDAVNKAIEDGQGERVDAGIELAIKAFSAELIDSENLDETILDFIANLEGRDELTVEQVMAIVLKPHIDVESSQAAIEQARRDYADASAADQRLSDILFGEAGEAGMLEADLAVTWPEYENLLTQLENIDQYIAEIAPEDETHDIILEDNAADTLENLDTVVERIAEIEGTYGITFEVTYNDPGPPTPQSSGTSGGSTGGTGGDAPPDPDSPQSRASGGRILPGEAYLVGDGPGGQIGPWTELFVPESSGMIVSSSQLQTALNAVGGGRGGIEIGQIILQGGATEDDGRRFVRGVYDELSLAEARFGR